MLAADPDTLLYCHNNPPEQIPTVVEPIAAALRRRWPGTVLVAGIRDVHVWLGADPRITIAGQDVVPARTYARIFNATYGPALTRALRALGSEVVNCPDAVALAGNKFEAAAVLCAAGLPVPDQMLFPSHPFPELLEQQQPLGWPRIIKANTGRGGDSVWRVHTDAEIRAHAAEDGPAQPWVAQQYLAEAAGRDLRVLVIDGKVEAAMERKSGDPAEFRANLALGGTAHAVEITEREHAVAVHAAAVLGLTVAGVDLLRTDAGAMITEVNPNPALTGISALHGGERLYDAVAAAVTGP